MAGKIAVGYSPVMTFSAMRTALGAACLLLVLAVTRRSFRPPPLLYTALIGLLQTTAFVGLNTIGLAGAGAGKVAVLTYTMPFFLLLLAWAFLGERLRGLQWPAVVLAFTGLLLVVSPWTLEGLWPSLVTVLGGLAWAGSALVVKLMQRKHPDVDVLSLTTWQMVIGCLPLIALAIVTQSGWPQWTAGFILGLAYTTVLANAVAWVLWLFALHRLSAGEAGLGTLVDPGSRRAALVGPARRGAEQVGGRRRPAHRRRPRPARRARAARGPSRPGGGARPVHGGGGAGGPARHRLTERAQRRVPVTPACAS